MSIMLKRAKFEYLSENVISKLIQKKAIFIIFQRNFMETLDNFFFIEGNQSLCFMINKYNFTIYYFMKLFEKILLLFRNKIETDIYIIIFNTIRYFIYIFGSKNLFYDNAPHDIVYYDEYCSCFLRRELLEHFFHKYMEESVRTYHLVQHQQGRRALPREKRSQ